MFVGKVWNFLLEPLLKLWQFSKRSQSRVVQFVSEIYSKKSFINIHIVLIVNISHWKVFLWVPREHFKRHWVLKEVTSFIPISVSITFHHVWLFHWWKRPFSITTISSNSFSLPYMHSPLPTHISRENWSFGVFLLRLKAFLHHVTIAVTERMHSKEVVIPVWLGNMDFLFDWIFKNFYRYGRYSSFS